MSQKRTDELGRAYAGSQLQMQIYVARRRNELSHAVLKALQKIGKRFSSIHWVAPLEELKFYEPRDRVFLAAVKLEHLGAKLSDFWPARGPRWDALALLRPDNAVLLVEAKSYPKELLGGGCKAGATTKSRIEQSLGAAKKSFAVKAGVNWLGPLYQYANRLAHVHFLNDVCGHPALLANVCFLDDPHCPTPMAAWQSELEALKAELGFLTAIPNTIDVFLEARPRAELLGERVRRSNFDQSITG